MTDTDRFADRTEAGRRLGEALRERAPDVDVVLAVPRGGLPVGRAVADALDVPLDVVAATKIGAPDNPELAIGAVASDGTVWRDATTVRHTGASVSYFERQRDRALETAREKSRRYREGRPAVDLAGKTVAVVDDGVATGATLRACLLSLRSAGVERVVVGVPVGPPDTVGELRALADRVVCLVTPTSFGGVGAFYEDFRQVPDEEAMAYLETDG